MALRLSIVIFVVLLSLGTLLLTSGGEGSDSIIVVDAAVVASNPTEFRNREIRMRGFVKPGSVLRYGDRADFIVMQEESEVTVHFTGETQLPDTFQDGAPVRVDGKLDGPKLVSHSIEAKCASKYEAEHAERLDGAQYLQKL